MLTAAAAKSLVKKCESVSKILGGLSHPVRLKVLCQVMEGEKSVQDLTEFCGISQSAMSQFLARMRNEGMIKSRREGSRVFYDLADPSLGRLLSAVREIYC